MEKVYEKKIYVKAFQFDGDATKLASNPDVPNWVIEAYECGIIKIHDSETLYIDHRERTAFIENGDYIIKNGFGYIFSIKKSDFEKVYVPKDLWISCKDRLPEEKINPITNDYYEYQVTYKNGDTTDIRHYKFGDNHWWNSGQNMDKYVVAWRELPQVYEEVEDD